MHNCVRTCIVSSAQITKCSDFIQSVRLGVAPQSCPLCLLYVYLRPHSFSCMQVSDIPQVPINLASFVHSGLIKCGTRSSQNVKGTSLKVVNKKMHAICPLIAYFRVVKYFVDLSWDNANTPLYLLFIVFLYVSVKMLILFKAYCTNYVCAGAFIVVNRCLLWMPWKG